MKAKHLSHLLSRTIPANMPVLITGAPGIGKSDIVAQAAQAAGAALIISHPAVSDPTRTAPEPDHRPNAEAEHRERILPMTYDAEWWSEMREMEAAGKLRRTVKQIAEWDMANASTACIAYTSNRRSQLHVYMYASIAASCGRELLGEHAEVTA